MKRSSGILLPVFSLPSPYGIGTLGKAAYAFVDFLEAAGQSWWQMLPVGPTSYGDSPYQSFSSYAGNPYFIDLDLLVEEGLLEKEDLQRIDWGADSGRVDYEKIYRSRFAVLERRRGKALPATGQKWKRLWSSRKTGFRITRCSWPSSAVFPCGPGVSGRNRCACGKKRRWSAAAQN